MAAIERAQRSAQQSHHLAHEEGIAGRDLVQPRNQLRCRRRAGDRRQVRADVVGAQPLQSQPLAGASQSAEGSAQLADAGLPVPVGRDQYHPDAGERLRQEAQQQQRRLVGGVHVVQRDQQRPIRRRMGQETTDGVEQPDPLTLGRNAARPAGQGCARLRGCCQLVEVTAERAQHLDPRPVGRCAAFLPAAAAGHGQAAVGGGMSQLSDQPSLADAGLAA